MYNKFTVESSLDLSNGYPQVGRGRQLLYWNQARLTVHESCKSRRYGHNELFSKQITCFILGEFFIILRVKHYRTLIGPLNRWPLKMGLTASVFR